MGNRKARLSSQDVKQGLSQVLIDKANQCEDPLGQVNTDYEKLTAGGHALTVWCGRSSTMEQQHIHQCVELTRLNMSTMYKQSPWGWDDEDKLKEFVHPTAYFIQIRRQDDPDQLVAFVHFRFELDEDKARPVCYCYELQVSPKYLRIGLGRYLMNALEQIGRHFRMKKMLLTCFVQNQIAMQFYKDALGYHIDRFSPSRFPTQSTFYEILSKKID